MCASGGRNVQGQRRQNDNQLSITSVWDFSGLLVSTHVSQNFSPRTNDVTFSQITHRTISAIMIDKIGVV